MCERGNSHCFIEMLGKGLRKEPISVEQESEKDIRVEIETLEIFLMADSKRFRVLRTVKLSQIRGLKS